MPPKERFEFSGPVLDEAERALKTPSTTVKEVAANLGCDPQSLRQALRQRRTGKSKSSIDARLKHREEVSKRLHAGEAVSVMTAEYGVTRQAMYSLIKRMGIDVKKLRKGLREQKNKGSEE